MPAQDETAAPNAAGATPAQQPTNPDYLLSPPNAGTSGPVANDPAHRQNELMGPDRGEFGRHAAGSTHGGYGGFQPGREEGGAYTGPLGTAPATTGYDGERAQTPAGFADNSNGSFGSQPEHAPANATVSPTYANDNAAPQGTYSGFAPDYGSTSLGGTSAGEAAPQAGQRNQTEDYRPGHPEQRPDGLVTGAAPTNAAQGRHEADTTPSNPEQRSGYQAAGSPDAQGSQQTGFGSRGGSYNDEYDAASEDAGAQGSPSRGDYDRQDAAQNYGGAAADRTNAPDAPDYGPAPTRQ